ncbi:MAG: hypothetical protein BWY99_02916 [Synergistetes bacterium ADurb.BinA166]|nr:MAG: hypothetical protein BWY99_02916 [Synergistetes bacterium ADurb.BinA166]
MSQVVVGFDGSEPSQHALAWAAEEADKAKKSKTQNAVLMIISRG